MAALPGDRLSAALMVKSHGTVSVDDKVSDADLTYLEEVANSTGQEVDKSRLTSQAFARAALITDVGIALATELETAGQKWSLGFPPKFQRVDLFNYNVLVRNYDSSAFKGDRYHNTKNGINADIGASTDLDDNWTLGLVAQNLIPRSIETKEVNGITETFRIRPQVTAGVSWHNAMFTTAFDVDLTRPAVSPPTATVSLPPLAQNLMPGNGHSCAPVTVRIWPVTTAVHSRPGWGSHRLMWFTLMLQA